MQAQQKFVFEIVFTLFKSFPQLLFLKCYLTITPSVALLFLLSLCSVFKVQVEGYTLKIEQCKNEKA